MKIDFGEFMGRREPKGREGVQVGETVRLQSALPIQNFKKTYFVDTKISMVLRESPFSESQTLKSADDHYTELLKKLNKTQEVLHRVAQKERVLFK